VTWLRAGPSARAVALWAAAWIALICGFYYRQIWRVVVAGLWPWPMLDGPRDASLPYVGEALRSAATSIVTSAVLVVAAVVVGLTIIRVGRWELDGAAERLPVAASLGIGVLAYLGLALAALGAYRMWVLRAIVAGIGVAVLVWTALARPTWRRSRMPRVTGTDRVWLVVATLPLGFALWAALAPVVDYDAVWYHLHFPRVFLAHGRLVDLRAEYVSLYPMMWELWFGYGLAVGGATTATLLHSITLPLTAMVVFAMTRRYAWPASPWFAAALFLTTPTVLWDATTPYVDLAFTLHVAVALVALLRYHETERARWVVLAAIQLGFALATKHVGLIVLAIVCAGMLVARWQTGRRPWPAFRVAAALGAASLLVPLPWYIRAWQLTGDPVFPELFGIFGAPADRWDEQTRAGLQRFFARFGRPRTVLNQLTLPWDMTMHAERYAGTLGPLFLALVPLALLRLWRSSDHHTRRDRGSQHTLGLLTAFAFAYLVLWASPLASFQVRWLLAVTPALAVLAAAGYERASASVAETGSGAARALAAGMAVLLVLNLPPFTPLHEHERRDWDSGAGWLSHVVHGMPLVTVGAESREGYVRRLVPTYAAWTAARPLLSPAARVLTWSGGDHFYATESRIWVFTPAARAAATAPPGDERRAFELLRRLGITHILIDKQFLRANAYDPSFTWESFALTNARTVLAHYERQYEDDRAVFYRIRWDSMPEDR